MNSTDFQGCTKEFKEVLKSGSNKELLAFEGGRTLIFRARLKKSCTRKNLISKEFEINEGELNKCKSDTEKDNYILSKGLQSVNEDVELICKQVFK